MTPFRLLLDATGLSVREAAAFLKIREDTAMSWSSGRRTTPDGVIDELFTLLDRQRRAASETIDQIRILVRRQGVMPEQIEIGISADDHEAWSLGWPAASAHAAVARMVLEQAPPDLRHRLLFVPRGSTSASAAATDAHRL